MKTRGPAPPPGAGRVGAVAVLTVLAAGLALGACSADQPVPSSRDVAPEGFTPAQVHISTTVVASSLAATDAIADFGIEEGIRMVRVRILDELQLELGVEVEGRVILAGPPRVCLVGPFWAPDDAGLTDRCWGEPDLGGLLAARLATDTAGHPVLDEGHPIRLAATIRRGDVRCDYPPGTWQLEVRLEPLADGLPAEALDLPPVDIHVPADVGNPRPLPMVRESRYCGLANVVYREQGEPPIAPSPSQAQTGE